MSSGNHNHKWHPPYTPHDASADEPAGATAGGNAVNKMRGALKKAFALGETVRTNILDAADAATGTGNYRRTPDSHAPTTLPPLPPRTEQHHYEQPHYEQSQPQNAHGQDLPALPSEHAGAASIRTTSGPGAGIGAGRNPMRAADHDYDYDAASAGAPAAQSAEKQHGYGAGTGMGMRSADASVAAAAARPAPETETGMGLGAAGKAVAAGAPAGPGMMGGGAM